MPASLVTYATPVSILVAGVLIGGALYASQRAPAVGSTSEDKAATLENFRMPEESGHVRGNPEGTVTLIEFSDFECSFCARFHPTLHRIVEEHKDVRWVYRHFPLTSIHSRATGAAVASECVARLGGNDAFWRFTDAVFGNQRSIGSELYASVVSQLGIDQNAFASCLKDPLMLAEVEQDADEAVRAGGRATPFSVLVTASGELVPFSGALPYEDVKRLVEQAKAD